MSEPVAPSLPSEQVSAVAEAEHAVDTVLLKRIFEAALLTSQEPLSIAELKRLSEVPLETSFVEELLQQLADKYVGQRYRTESRGQRLALPWRAPNCKTIWTNSTRRKRRAIRAR